MNYTPTQIIRRGTMKLFKCPNCKDESIKKDSIIMVQCPCGYHMEELQRRHNGTIKGTSNQRLNTRLDRKIRRL